MTVTYEVIWRELAAPEPRPYTWSGTISETARNRRAGLQPWEGFDRDGRVWGLIGLVARDYPLNLVSVGGVPADLLWLAELVFDHLGDATWAVSFWERAEAAVEGGRIEGAAWRVAARLVGEVGAMIQEGIAVTEEEMGKVEEVLGHRVSVDRAPSALARLAISRGVTLEGVRDAINQELAITTI